MDRLARLVAKRHAVILILVAIAVARIAPANAQTTLPLTCNAASKLDTLVREAVANNPGVIAARALAGAYSRADPGGDAARPTGVDPTLYSR